MAVLSMFREPSLCRHVHRELLRSTLLDLAPIISATACHQRNYVERYSRSMGLWAKSVVIFNTIREHGKQSIRRLADRTGLSKSSVHRHLQAMDRRDRSPESSLWETPAGHAWLSRLVVATLLVCGLKRGVGAETIRAFFSRLRLEAHVGCSPSALRHVLHTLERLL